jgi:hypothetical protein
VWDERYAQRESPPFQGGVAATTKKCREASFDEADGAVVPKTFDGSYEPPRLRRNLKELYRRSHPALQRRGLSLRVCPLPHCPH